MPRPPRADEAGGLYHALNRGNPRATIFHNEEDFEAFEQVLFETLQMHKVKLFSFQLMPNHTHLVLRPLLDGEMSRFMGWIGGTHTMRYPAHDHTSGMGHVYQQRYKSFAPRDDDPFYVVCRYARAKRVAGRTGRTSRTVALGIAVALASQARTEPATVVSVTDAPPSRMGWAGQRAAIRERIGSGATIGAAGSATGG